MSGFSAPPLRFVSEVLYDGANKTSFTPTDFEFVPGRWYSVRYRDQSGSNKEGVIFYVGRTQYQHFDQNYNVTLADYKGYTAIMSSGSLRVFESESGTLGANVNMNRVEVFYYA